MRFRAGIVGENRDSEKAIERLQATKESGGVDILAKNREAIKARLAPFCEDVIGEAIQTFVEENPKRRDQKISLCPTSRNADTKRVRTAAECAEVFTTPGENHPLLARFMRENLANATLQEAICKNEKDSPLAKLMEEAKEQIAPGQGNPWRIAIYGTGRPNDELANLWKSRLEIYYRGPGESLQHTDDVITTPKYKEVEEVLTGEHDGRTIFLAVGEIYPKLVSVVRSARTNVECFVPVGLLENRIDKPTMLEAIMDGVITPMKSGINRDGDVLTTVSAMAGRLFEEWVFDDLGRAAENTFKLVTGEDRRKLGPLMTALYAEPPRMWGDKNSWHSRLREALDPFIQGKLGALTAEQPNAQEPLPEIDVVAMTTEIVAMAVPYYDNDFSREALRPPWLG